MKKPDVSAESVIAIDRRREPRRAATGPVRLYREDFMAGAVEGVLPDVSPHGFQASHNAPSLGQGDFVRFEHAFGSGRARVVWTRVMGAQVNSGFLLVPPKKGSA